MKSLGYNPLCAVSLGFVDVCAARTAISITVRKYWSLRKEPSVRQMIKEWIRASRALKAGRLV